MTSGPLFNHRRRQVQWSLHWFFNDLFPIYYFNFFKYYLKWDIEWWNFLTPTPKSMSSRTVFNEFFIFNYFVWLVISVISWYSFFWQFTYIIANINCIIICSSKWTVRVLCVLKVSNKSLLSIRSIELIFTIGCINFRIMFSRT